MISGAHRGRATLRLQAREVSCLHGALLQISAVRGLNFRLFYAGSDVIRLKFALIFVWVTHCLFLVNRCQLHKDLRS